MSLPLLALVALTGGLGAVARFAFSQRVVRLAARRNQGKADVDLRRLPALGTAAVNLLGAFGAGFLYGRPASDGLAVLSTVLSVGFFGAFTTFSAWMAEVVDLWATGRRALALLHLLGLLSAGLVLAFLGAAIARRG